MAAAIVWHITVLVQQRYSEIAGGANQLVQVT